MGAIAGNIIAAAVASVLPVIVVVDIMEDQAEIVAPQGSQAQGIHHLHSHIVLKHEN